MSNPISDDTLDELRRIGDPSLSNHTPSIPDDILDDALAEMRVAGLSGILHAGSDLSGIVDPTSDHPLVSHTTIEAIATIATDGQFSTANGTFSDQIDIDGEMLVRAQQLFARFGNEIAGALLLAGLPQTYAAEPGSAVLTATGRLQQDLQRRVRGTAQFLMVVMQQAPGRTESDRQKAAAAMWDPSSDQPQSQTGVDQTRPDPTAPPWKMCAALRFYHQSIRTQVRRIAKGDERLTRQLGLDMDQEVLNQEDLLGTLLTFTIAVFEVLEQMGITWSEDDKAAYLHAWDIVGLHLGIGDSKVREQLSWSPPQFLWQGLRPLTVKDSQALLDQIRGRQWVTREPTVISDKDWKTARPGRLLIRSLVEELELAMPPRTRSWPLALMRYLAPDVVQERLLLGGPGVILGSMKHLSRQRLAHTSMTSLRGRPKVEARVIRMMSNEVTRRALVHFIREGHFVIPGLEDWSDGFDHIDSLRRV